MICGLLINENTCLDLVDRSGIKLYVTKNLRKTEFGVLTIGTGGWYGQVIPPQAQKFDFSYACNRNCTDVKNTLFYYNNYYCTNF